ncbi:hypothetical protein [Paludibacterium sp.]|uniref:hypothetical protein n=1 Tax=Paludibacterium sp. TaxID=1917523 RepID=UPI0025E186F1|nr:hypothetical protein [Paludibacterium sp.]MBV8648503.1 hypothetical protein [Paludibacterium sp.]
MPTQNQPFSPFLAACACAALFCGLVLPRAGAAAPSLTRAPVDERALSLEDKLKQPGARVYRLNCLLSPVQCLANRDGQRVVVVRRKS